MAFDPSIGIVSMEARQQGSEAEGAKVDARVALGLRATLHWSRTWRGVLGIDGEVAPASAIGARRIDPVLPPLPAYSVGLTFGVDVAIR
ncbi:Hypothetical protein A7982_03918 [Minicystis rosea]|nr:Hypothetical protein A7982_03918 [Minicystis rosea]